VSAAGPSGFQDVSWLSIRCHHRKQLDSQMELIVIQILSRAELWVNAEICAIKERKCLQNKRAARKSGDPGNF
jgi:hypothetical protein